MRQYGQFQALIKPFLILLKEKCNIGIDVTHCFLEVAQGTIDDVPLD